MICREGLPLPVGVLFVPVHPYVTADTWFPGLFVLFQKRLPCGHAGSMGEAYMLRREIEDSSGCRATIVSPYDRAPAGLTRGRGIVRRPAGGAS